MCLHPKDPRYRRQCISYQPIGIFIFGVYESKGQVSLPQKVTPTSQKIDATPGVLRWNPECKEQLLRVTFIRENIVRIERRIGYVRSDNNNITEKDPKCCEFVMKS